MTKNKGFTYYELLIVVSIMALMVGFTTISLGAFYRNNVYRYADNIETAVKAARNNAVTKGTSQGWVNFYYSNKTLYAYVGDKISPSNPRDFSTQNWQKVAKNCNEVVVDGVHMGDGTSVSFNFKQSTGEFLGLDWTMSAAPGLHHNATYIRVESGSNSARVNVDLFGTIKIE